MNTTAARQAEQLALLKEYAPLVRKIAGGFQRKLPRSVLREDLISAGMLGLWDAILRDKHGRDSFEWYARVRIRGAILDELRTEDWLPRRARAQAGAGGAPTAVIRFDDLSDGENAWLQRASANQPQLDDDERGERLSLALATLTPRYREIVLSILAGEKLRDIGKRLGVSEPRVSQIKSRAIAQLRHTLRVNRAG